MIKYLFILFLLIGCTSTPPEFCQCINGCTKQGDTDLDLCKQMSGKEFHGCYSSQLLKELRCTQSCYPETCSTLQ